MLAGFQSFLVWFVVVPTFGGSVLGGPHAFDFVIKVVLGSLLVLAFITILFIGAVCQSLSPAKDKAKDKAKAKAKDKIDEDGRVTS